MDKPLTYSSLADLLEDYVDSYKKWWHTVLRIRIGLPVPHDVMYDGQVRAWPLTAWSFPRMYVIT